MWRELGLRGPVLEAKECLTGLLTVDRVSEGSGSVDCLMIKAVKMVWSKYNFGSWSKSPDPAVSAKKLCRKSDVFSQKGWVPGELAELSVGVATDVDEVDRGRRERPEVVGVVSAHDLRDEERVSVLGVSALRVRLFDAVQDQHLQNREGDRHT